jgi:hypothetical protein
MLPKAAISFPATFLLELVFDVDFPRWKIIDWS